MLKAIRCLFNYLSYNLTKILSKSHSKLGLFYLEDEGAMIPRKFVNYLLVYTE
jgi:hypothetical protein